MTRSAPSSAPTRSTTAQWFEVVETAHRLGIRTTATIMFGHVDHYRHWARHLLRLRDLQIAHRRPDRICAVAVRSDRDANSSARRQPAGADLSRSRADACRRPPRASSGGDKHPDFMGQDGARWRRRVPAGRRQRSWRHVDEREHHPGRGRRSWTRKCRRKPWRTLSLRLAGGRGNARRFMARCHAERIAASFGARPLLPTTASPATASLTLD